ncbi:hypothetical protein KIPB_017193, partial [Kipferlia bialata]
GATEASEPAATAKTKRERGRERGDADPDAERRANRANAGA